LPLFLLRPSEAGGEMSVAKDLKLVLTLLALWLLGAVITNG
jgi:hypothetical protein